MAREQQASQIVLGKPRGWKALDVFRGGSLLDRVLRDSGDIDVHAIRAEAACRRRSGQPNRAWMLPCFANTGWPSAWSLPSPL